jgi:hypothetical protein
MQKGVPSAGVNESEKLCIARSVQHRFIPCAAVVFVPSLVSAACVVFLPRKG